MAVATKFPSLPKAPELAISELPLVYEVSKRSASQWKQKNPDPRRQAKTINSAKIINLSVKSRWRAGGNLGNVDTQYVPGAPTIFVNDYVDAQGNVQPGLKKLYPGGELEREQYNRGVKAGICFVDGYLFLENFGGKDNRLLLEFVYHHALNEGGPNFLLQRDLNSVLLFKPFQPEKKAELSLVNMEKERDGMNLFFSARSPSGEYHVEKLNALLGMYGLGGGLSFEENAQKMQLLAPYAKLNPAKFADDWAKETEEYRVSIGVATSLGVLAFTSKDVKMNIGSEMVNLVSLNSAKADDANESLIYYFMGTEAGKRDYSRMTGEIEVQKIAKLSK